MWTRTTEKSPARDYDEPGTGSSSLIAIMLGPRRSRVHGHGMTSEQAALTRPA